MDCSVGEVRAVFTNVLTALWTYLWKLPRKYLLQTNFAPSSTYCFLFYMIKELNEFKVCVLIPGFCRYFYVCGYPLILFFRKYVVRNRFYQKTIFWWKLWISIREEKAYWVRPWAWQNALSISSYLSLELLLVSHGFHNWKEIISFIKLFNFSSLWSSPFPPFLARKPLVWSWWGTVCSLEMGTKSEKITKWICQFTIMNFVPELLPRSSNFRVNHTLFCFLTAKVSSSTIYQVTLFVCLFVPLLK